MAQKGRPPRLATRVRTRLLAIVLVPILGLSVLTARAAVADLRLADGSSELSRGADRVAHLTPVALLLSREAYLVTAVYAAHDFGLTTAQAGELLGVDLEAELAAVRGRIDALFDGLPPGDPAQAHRDTWRSIRARAERGEIELEDAGSELDGLSHTVHRDAVAAIDRAEARALDLDGTARVHRSLAVLRAADEAAWAAYSEVGEFGSMLGDLFGVDVSLDALAEGMRDMRAATARLEASAANLDRLASGPVARAWRVVRTDGTVQANEEAVAAIGAGQQELPSSLAELAALIGPTAERLARYDHLAEVAATTAAAEATRLGDEVRDRLRTDVPFTVALVVLSLLVVALIARSIARPLQRLELAAKRVSAGDLSRDELPVGGPREVASVTATLGEAVDNLRAVEAQLDVLAAGDLDDEVLDRPVPGRLGALLHDAVARLSRSMTERDSLGRRLRHEATHDALTGLPNRAAANEELRRVLARARRSGSPVGVLYVDLDGFKHVNDHHGHEAGDTILRAVADRLAAGVRAGDFVGRIGGDEFIVVTDASGDPRDLVELGERLVASVARPVPIGVGATRVGASVGISLTSDGQLDVDGVLREADLAVYRAKAGGRQRVELFDDSLRAEVDRRADTERALRDALQRDELELHFQPVVDQEDGGVSSVEALLRWDRPGVGPVSPAEFIPVAEGGDLIIDVDRWVLRRACQHLVAWRDDPELRGMAMSVNLSGRHILSLTAVDDVRRALEATGADPALLSVEITETVLLKEMPVVVDQLEGIRALGVRVAIDDFGTGYTSLTHLRSLPADVLKIDRSLVVAAGVAPDSHVLRLLVGTAHALGMRLVAEGVETDEQLADILAAGCDLVQGFLFSRPTPAADLPGALAALRRRAAA